MPTKELEDEAHRKALCERVSYSAEVLIRLLRDPNLHPWVLDLIIVPPGYLEIKRMRGMVDEAIPGMFVQDLRDDAPKIRQTFLWHFKGLVEFDEIAAQADLEKFESLLPYAAPSGNVANLEQEWKPPSFTD